MKIQHHYIFLCLFGFILFSCSENDSEPEFVDQPVVEAYLKVGDYVNVKISRQTPYTSEYSFSSDNIDSLNVKVIFEDSIYTLSSKGNGEYVDSDLIIKEGAKYELRFTFNNKLVSATTTIPIKPVEFKESASYITMEDMSSGPPISMPEPIKFTWNNSDGSYYIVVAENIENDPTAIRDFDTGSPPPNIFRNSPIQESSYDIQPMSFWYYGTYRLVLFHINPDYASLYDDNGKSSLNLSAPSTGITNGIGIFTGINSDTLWLEVIKG
jgi:hypothetical protein